MGLALPVEKCKLCTKPDAWNSKKNLCNRNLCTSLNIDYDKILQVKVQHIHKVGRMEKINVLVLTQEEVQMCYKAKGLESISCVQYFV
jgi:hypothetical protein